MNLYVLNAVNFPMHADSQRCDLHFCFSPAHLLVFLIADLPHFSADGRNIWRMFRNLKV